MKTKSRSGVTRSSKAVTTLRSGNLTTTAIAAAAIALFTVTGGTLLSTNLDYWRGVGPAPEPQALTTFLLNVALVLFAWRRSSELRRQSAARAAAEGEALDLRNRDQMTGLYNRHSLRMAAQEQLDRPGSRVTMLVMDLDHFKKVNDLHGHGTGDTLLQWVSATLTASAPPDACCARLGGDEFAVLLSGVDAEAHNAERLAAAIVQRLAQPIEVEGKLTHISTSVGLSDLYEEGLQVEDLLRHSDIAMYEAKRRGRNQYLWFNAAMASDLRQRNQIEAEMREGIGRGEFVPYFQPQINLASGEVKGFEVLARWHHPTRGHLEPGAFIGIAEASGLIAPLSLSVMRTALECAKAWDPTLMIAVNISPVQLKDPLLGQRITKILTETGFPAGRLELEITESSLFDDLDLALATIEGLKNLGIQISLDDFGTGYSSLTQLQSLPFDRIKIDRSFVTSMRDNAESAAIVTAILHLASSLKLPVTAEGVETGGIQTLLRNLGCADAQGWLFGKPVCSEAIDELYSVERLPSTDSKAPERVEGLQERRDMGRRGFKRRA